jgi:hypothetical protein
MGGLEAPLKRRDVAAEGGGSSSSAQAVPLEHTLYLLYHVFVLKTRLGLSTQEWRFPTRLGLWTLEL